LLKAVKGMVAGTSRASDFGGAKEDVEQRSTATGGKLPHSVDPIVAVVAQAGLATVAGQDIQMAANDTIHIGSGQDTNQAIGGAFRLHTGQAIGILGGATKPGDQAAGKGVTFIAGKGDIEYQAQASTITIAAKQDVKIQSQTQHIDWAAAKKIVLSVAGGASLTIEGGNITFECPGKLLVKASKKSFVAGARATYQLPKLPAAPIEDVPLKFNMRLQDVPGPAAEMLPKTDWRIVRAKNEDTALWSDEQILAGISTSKGKLDLTESEEKLLAKEYNKTPGRLWVIANSHVSQLWVTKEKDDWSDDQKRLVALDAKGYSDDWGSTDEQDVYTFHDKLASDETKLKTGAELLADIKKGAA
jgi:type VI secretion system secreted protein VgrG